MKKIKFKKQKKDDILKKVEELETYANAVKIFKEFDRNRLKNLEKISPQKDDTIVTETITTYRWCVINFNIFERIDKWYPRAHSSSYLK